MLILTAFVSSCSAPDSSNGTYRVRIPIDNGSGKYVQSTVELKSVTSLSKMEGSAAVIKDRGSFKFFQGTDSVESDPGYTPNAKFILSSGVYIPQDPESLLLTTTMAHFEKLKDFYDLRNSTSLMKFPQNVMVQVDSSSIERLTGPSAHNAFFIPGLSLFVFNLGGADSIPVAMNSGVIAHEYFHSVFASLSKFASQQREVWRGNGMNIGNDQINLYLNDACKNSAINGNVTSTQIKMSQKFVIDSINEGMADYFAYEYTGNPGWILATLPRAENRNLATPKILECGIEDQKKWMVYESQYKSGNLTHEVGSIFAHFLYLTSQARKSHGDLNGTILQVLKFISKIDDKVQGTATPISLTELVELFLAQSDRLDDSCAAADHVFHSSLDATKGSCAPGPRMRGLR